MYHIFKQKAMALRKQKCNKCKCWRTKKDFKRRNKYFKTCNLCADANKKYQQKIKTVDTRIEKQTNEAIDTEPIITLVDLWPDLKDSSNSDAVKNDPKIKYTVLWDNPKGMEEVDCKYDEIPSSFKFRIPDSDTISSLMYD